MKRPYEGQLSSALATTRPRMAQLPWERPGVLSAVLTGRISCLMPTLPLKHLEISPSVHLGVVGGSREHLGSREGVATLAASSLNCMGALGHCGFRFMSVPLKAASEARERALRRWSLLLLRAPLASTGGLQLLEAARSGDQAMALQILSDLFARKATATLDRRAGSLALFVHWCDAHAYTPVLPVDEERAYSYVSYLRSSGAPATRAESFLQALAFSKGVVGLRGVDEVLGSGRVTGSAFNSFLAKRPLKQRDPLTVEQLLILERVVQESDSDPDAVAAGAFLFGVYSRSRYNDMAGAHDLRLDLDGDGGGYLEACTLKSKTGGTKEKKTRFLPIVAPINGVGKCAWGVRWMERRAKSGLSSPTSPVVPSLKPDGTWRDTPLHIRGASLWLLDLLETGGAAADSLKNVGTHSMKTTTLSWAAKFGLDHDTRRLLGGHVAVGDKSMLTYSRDAMSAPLRQLERILEAVRSGAFSPDCTRSGHFARPSQAPELAIPKEAPPESELSWTHLSVTDEEPDQPRGRSLQRTPHRAMRRRAALEQ